MQRERLLVGLLVALLSATLVAIAFVPQAVASHDEPVRQAALDIEEIQISTTTVGGETVALTSDARLTNAGGVSRDVTVEFRAVDLETGLLATSNTVEVGTLEGNREVSVNDTLSVERAGDYQVEAVVFRGGQRVATGVREVRGTDSLTPAYADSPVGFHQFSRQGLPVIEYTIEAAENNRTRLSVSTYLTNTGDRGSDDLRLLLTARQIDSSVVADQQAIQVSPIEPGQTATPETTLTVPEGYNYYLDAVLWKEGVIIGTARSGAQLDPRETIPENTTTRESEFEAGEFVESAAEQRDTPTPRAEDASDGPGFGVGTALLAVLTAAFLSRRRQND